MIDPWIQRFWFNYQGKTPHKIDRSASKAFIEYLLNYKTFSGFPLLEKTAADLTGPVSQQLVPDSFFWLGDFSFQVINFWRIRQNYFWKEIFISTERKNIHRFWQVGYFKWRRFCRQLYIFFFIVIWTQTAGFVTALNPPSSLFGISCRFQFHNLWRAWNRQHWLFIILHFSIFTVTMEPQFREGV